METKKTQWQILKAALPLGNRLLYDVFKITSNAIEALQDEVKVLTEQVKKVATGNYSEERVAIFDFISKANIRLQELEKPVLPVENLTEEQVQDILTKELSSMRKTINSLEAKLAKKK